MFVVTSADFERRTYDVYPGIASAASSPRIAITVISSSNVKPPRLTIRSIRSRPFSLPPNYNVTAKLKAG
jgi:hypothetical protein